jgi:heavy metal sensor kinase
VTLTTRLSVFFLAALAMVLAGFSATLFLLARSYLYRQVDERLESALDTLSASVEEGPDGIEWESTQRHFSLGQDDAPDQVRWVVLDAQGNVVDRSRNLSKDDALVEMAWSMALNSAAFDESSKNGSPRRVLQRRVPEFTPTNVVGVHATQSTPTIKPEIRYSALALTAAISRQPAQTALSRLAVALFGLSAAIWATACIVGRRYCRRALRPVTRMASAARAMQAADQGRRLPVAATGDELENLGQSFNGLLGRLQESFERQKRFTSDASHQLRTPLAAMLGQVEVALRRSREPAEYQQTLTMVREHAIHLQAIVEALLFLARTEAEAKSPNAEPLELGAWMKRHLSSWSSHPRASDLCLECAADLGIMAPAPLLSQLIDNLLDNACKYSEPGSPITIHVGTSGDHARVLVEDRGSGIPARDLPHIFEPFYRSPEARRLGKSGVGLGLAVARRIAVALGGSLEAQSEVGHGSRFTLRLPLEAVKIP